MMAVADPDWGSEGEGSHEPHFESKLFHFHE